MSITFFLLGTYWDWNSMLCPFWHFLTPKKFWGPVCLFPSKILFFSSFIDKLQKNFLVVKNRVLGKSFFTTKMFFCNLPMKNEKNKILLGNRQTRLQMFFGVKKYQKGITYCSNLNRFLIEKKLYFFEKKSSRGGGGVIFYHKKS